MVAPHRFSHSLGTAAARQLVDQVRTWRPAIATAIVCGAVATLVGCSPLEPMVEPEVSDLQLTVDTLKTTVRESQRTIVELRAELDARRQELADVQIARAQLEGRLREAERRLAEARHVIDLQREELAGSRAERERTARAGAALQNQMKQLQKQLSKLPSPTRDNRPAVAPAALPSAGQRVAPGTAADMEAPMLAIPALHQSDPPMGPSSSARPTSSPVLVKRGDTLWSIAKRHRVSVKRLMRLNHLSDAQIEVGQALWLTEPPTGADGASH